MELTELIVHKADIERRVVNDKLGAFDIFQKLVCHFRKGRFIQQELIGDTVHAERFWGPPVGRV